MASHKNKIVDDKFLDSNPDCYFVFGDNLERRGKGGAARLRGHPHAIGFITKKFPDNDDSSFYKPDEYFPVFVEELTKLVRIVKSRPNNTFYISQLGSGLANKYRIWEKVVHHNLVSALEKFDNIVFCWEENLT